MKKLLTLACVCLLIPSAYALDEKTIDLQLRRLDDVITRVRQQNDTLKQDMRSLQRTMDKQKKENERLKDQMDALLDEMLKVRNTDIANLQANQQKLYDNYGILNWGTEKRDCKGLDAKHQQIKVTQSQDQNYTLRYLCFDGRAIHLGTEVHQPPVD